MLGSGCPHRGGLPGFPGICSTVAPGFIKREKRPKRMSHVFFLVSQKKKKKSNERRKGLSMSIVFRALLRGQERLRWSNHHVTGGKTNEKARSMGCDTLH